jgi:hypothetical protein
MDVWDSPKEEKGFYPPVIGYYEGDFDNLPQTV